MKKDFAPYLTPPPITLVRRRWIIYILLLLLVLIILLPWHMFTTGMGRVTALEPNERIQEINAPVTGFIKKWHVNEGRYVQKNELLVELVDADPSLIERIETELEAARTALRSSELTLETADLNLRRQAQLLKEGLTARKDYEKAKIEVSKFQVEVSKAMSTLAKAETQVSRQRTQKVTAPRDGRVLRIIPGEGNQLIKSGDSLLVFAPEVSTPAVEMWISGNDIPFIRRGQNARLQFEGWPSVQVPGWPSVAIGTFNAKVFLVDYASSYQGKFRVLLVPSEVWPSKNFLRLNAHAKGIIYLRKSLLGVEIWRQLNDFPVIEGPILDELSRLLSNKAKMPQKLKLEENEKDLKKPVKVKRQGT